MIMQQPSRSKRTFFIVLIVILLLLAVGAGVYYWYTQRNKSVNSYAECVAAGNALMESSPEKCSTPEGKHFTNPEATITLEGTAVCLPHKNADDPHTMECAIGIKTDDGKYYGVSGDSENKLSGVSGTDKKVRVIGKIEKSTDTKYNIEELIAVSKIELL